MVEEDLRLEVACSPVPVGHQRLAEELQVVEVLRQVGLLKKMSLTLRYVTSQVVSFPLLLAQNQNPFLRLDQRQDHVTLVSKETQLQEILILL